MFEFDITRQFIRFRSQPARQALERSQDRRQADHVVLQRPQFRQIHGRRTIQHVVEDLPQRRRIRSHRWRHTFRQRTGCRRQTLQNPRARPVEVRAIGEGHLHEAVTEHALAANAFRMRHGEQRDRQRTPSGEVTGVWPAGETDGDGLAGNGPRKGYVRTFSPQRSIALPK